MKINSKILIFFIMSLVFVSGCQKENKPTDPVKNSQIIQAIQAMIKTMKI